MSNALTIAGVALTLIGRFAAGHVLTENEASALNQTFAENVRNNCAKKVKELSEAGTDVAAIQAVVDEYAANYDFGVRKATSQAVSRDPVARRATTIARNAVTAALKAKGIDKKTLVEGKFDELVAAFAAKPDTIEAARRAIETEKSVATADVDF
jgi:hypothetical protein